MTFFQRRWNVFRSIRGVMLSMIFGILIFALIVQALIYHNRFQDRYQDEFQANAEVACAVGAAFEGFVDSLLKQQLAIGTALLGAEDFTPESIQDFLTINVEGRPPLRAFHWIDPEGQVIYSGDPRTIGQRADDRLYFQRILEGEDTIISELVRSRITDEAVFVVARAFRDAEGRLLGVVAGSVLADELDRTTLRIDRFGEGSIVILDHHGRLVYRYPRIDLTWEERDWRSRFALIDEALREQAGKMDLVRTEWNGHDLIAAVDPIERFGWLAGASRPRDEALSGVYRDIYRTFSVSLIVYAMFLIVGLAVTRQIYRPIKRLEDHALSFAKGDYGRKIEPEGPVELANLGRVFDHMAHAINDRERQLEQRTQEAEEGRRILQRAEQALQQLNDELEIRVQKRTEELARSNAELEQFAYVASHDLQEPLRMVASYVQLLERSYGDRLDDKAREYIDFAVDGAVRMRKLIIDLLNYSRIGGKETLIESVDCESLLERVQSNLQAAIEENQARITHDPLPIIKADETQLLRVFQNLIENAIKFRRDVPPEIHVSARRGDAEWLFSVRDNGIGIEPDYFERIFMIFQRLHARRKYSGTGIGLAICKRIVERHGGSIRVESKHGEGSTFYFTIADKGADTHGPNDSD